MDSHLELRGITHRFGELIALDDVSLSVQPGSVHALLGENGAGKSTLVRIAAGLLRPLAGTIVAGSSGRSHHRGFETPVAARLAGIALVHQHFSSVPAFTVGENVALAAGWPPAGADQRATALSQHLGLPLDGRRLTADLPVQLRQRLEIVKALATDARVLLLDEPTAVLAPAEVEALLREIRSLAKRGYAIVLITHKLREVIAVADQVSVLRRGTLVLGAPVGEVSAGSLAAAMVGEGTVPHSRAASSVGDRVVIARGWCPSGSDVPLDFTLAAGEVVGVAAVQGNGERELLRGLAFDPASPALEIHGSRAFIPEDRITEGLFADLSVSENVLIGSPASGGTWIDWQAAARRAEELIASHDIRGANANTPVSRLSGGNQQKVVVGRALLNRPRLLVAEDPTRGLDIRAAAAVHELLRGAAQDGAAVVFHSSDLDEVLEHADRVIVMHRGAARMVPPGADRETVGAAMLGEPAVGQP